MTQQRVEVRLGDADDDVARVVALGVAHRAFGVRVLRHVGAEDGIDLVDEPVAHQEALGDVGGDPGVGSTGGARRARHVGVDVVEHDDVLAVDHPPAVTRARQRLAPEDVADRVGAFHHHLAVVQAADVGREERAVGVLGDQRVEVGAGDVDRAQLRCHHGLTLAITSSAYRRTLSIFSWRVSGSASSPYGLKRPNPPEVCVTPRSSRRLMPSGLNESKLVA